MPVVLSIAGFDSSGGAGTAADMRTFSSLGVRGLAVITCVTAQTDTALLAAEKTPPALMDAMFRAVAKADAVKTGMLFDEETVIRVCRHIRDAGFSNAVTDPVIESSAGARLLTKGGVEALKRELLPLCRLVTPNTDEAEILSGGRIKTKADIKNAAREIAALGAREVVITGGHMPGDRAIDTVFSDGSLYEVGRKRESGGTETRGTGCVFSAALCALIAKGFNTRDAVRGAGRAVAKMIRAGGAD